MKTKILFLLLIAIPILGFSQTPGFYFYNRLEIPVTVQAKGSINVSSSGSTNIDQTVIIPVGSTVQISIPSHLRINGMKFFIRNANNSSLLGEFDYLDEKNNFSYGSNTWGVLEKVQFVPPFYSYTIRPETAGLAFKLNAAATDEYDIEFKYAHLIPSGAPGLPPILVQGTVSDIIKAGERKKLEGDWYDNITDLREFSFKITNRCTGMVYNGTYASGTIYGNGLTIRKSTFETVASKHNYAFDLTEATVEKTDFVFIIPTIIMLCLYG